jgi:hypothetical protein
MLWLHKPKKKKASHISTPNLKKDENFYHHQQSCLEHCQKENLKAN